MNLTQKTGFIAGPLVCIILLVLGSPESMSWEAWGTAAVGIWMSIWWMTEAVPLPVTALLPLVLFPIMEISSIRTTATPYANPIIFLFLGAFIIAKAMEVWGLHKRIALSIINIIGASPASIIAGFMIATALLSMWISNTATALMMLPIALSVIELSKGDNPDAGLNNFGIALLLTIAYSCSLGGMASLVGTPTNGVLASYFLENRGEEISLAAWLQLGIPLSLISLPIMYVVLTRFVFPIRVKEIPGGKALIKSELKALGRITKPEVYISLVFGLVALLWVTKPLLTGIIPGISDTVVALFGAALLFVIPANNQEGKFLLSWKQAEQLPWGILLLFGGGLSLASTISGTGLATWIGEQLTGLGQFHPLLIIAVIVIVIVLLTELTSNVATAAAFLPVIVSLSDAIGVHPLMLSVPAVLAASCAFMLPVATPPNAVVYSSGILNIRDMMRGGLALNIIMMLIVSLFSYFLVPLIFDLSNS
ncbi:MAG: DASS family sodium-coupled anion symporter [Bacteroidota bacterium]